jgi:hypothetical protein
MFFYVFIYMCIYYENGIFYKTFCNFVSPLTTSYPDLPVEGVVPSSPVNRALPHSKDQALFSPLLELGQQ